MEVEWYMQMMVELRGACNGKLGKSKLRKRSVKMTCVVGQADEGS